MKTMCNCVELDCRRYGCKRTRGPIETEPIGIMPAGTTITSTVFEPGTPALSAIRDAVAAENLADRAA